MSNHTSPGPDGLPIEALRLEHIKDDALRIINEAFDAVELPLDLVTGTLTPIYKKKGDAHDPKNYRPIVLLPVVLKIMHKMLLLRLRDALDCLLLPCQAAYREGHSTIQNIVPLVEMMEEARTSRTPLYALFTDFSAAFDSVSRDDLFKLLESWHVPQRIITFLERSHAQQRLFVSFDGVRDSVPISPQKGVMQGDTLAPFLFILIIDHILQQVPYEDGVQVSSSALRRPLRVPALAYADDVVLLATSFASSQRQLTAFEKASLQWGLHLNVEKNKTELMIVAHPSVREHLQTKLVSSKGPAQRSTNTLAGKRAPKPTRGRRTSRNVSIKRGAS